MPPLCHFSQHIVSRVPLVSSIHKFLWVLFYRVLEMQVVDFLRVLPPSYIDIYFHWDLVSTILEVFTSYLIYQPHTQDHPVAMIHKMLEFLYDSGSCFQGFASI